MVLVVTFHGRDGMHISEGELPTFILHLRAGRADVSARHLGAVVVWTLARTALQDSEPALFGTLACLIAIPWVTLPIIAIADPIQTLLFLPLVCFVFS